MTVAGSQTLVPDFGFYRDLAPQGPVGTDAKGLCIFRYRELVRKNLSKEFDQIVCPRELEKHCDDTGKWTDPLPNLPNTSLTPTHD